MTSLVTPLSPFSFSQSRIVVQEANRIYKKAAVLKNSGSFEKVFGAFIVSTSQTGADLLLPSVSVCLTAQESRNLQLIFFADRLALLWLLT